MKRSDTVVLKRFSAAIATSREGTDSHALNYRWR